MKQNNLPQPLSGTRRHSEFEKKEKIAGTMDRVEKAFPNDQVLRFKEQNKQAKEVSQSYEDVSRETALRMTSPFPLHTHSCVGSISGTIIVLLFR